MTKGIKHGAYVEDLESIIEKAFDEMRRFADEHPIPPKYTGQIGECVDCDVNEQDHRNIYKGNCALYPESRCERFDKPFPSQLPRPIWCKNNDTAPQA